MGTKLNPGPFDCYHAALPDEPMFILLGRDESAPDRIRDWVAAKRKALLAERMASPDIDVESPQGVALTEDLRKCSNAEMIAHEMEIWRAENLGQWRAGNTRSTRQEIAPALRDMIEQETYRGVCQSLMAGTQQVVLVSHEVRGWSVPGFNVRDHVFRFESASEAFTPVLEGREIVFPDWHVAGFDAAIGDVRFRAESANVLHVALQIVGD